MLRICSLGKTRSFQREVLRQLFQAVGVQELETDRDDASLSLGAPFTEVWHISADLIPVATPEIAWRLGRLHRGDSYHADDFDGFAVDDLAIECRYHMLSTMLHTRAQRVQCWGAGYMFAEVTLRFAPLELAAAAYAALLVVMQYAERTGLEQPLPTLMQALSSFESQGALRELGSWRNEDQAIVLYDSDAARDEQQHYVELLRSSGIAAHVGEVESFLTDVLARG